ncbi:mannosyltransferase [Ceratobasidium sp. 394]|nr:mannosyltransferase [Ceratobasidium sp. 394]
MHHFQYIELTQLLNTTHLLPLPDPTKNAHTSKYDDDIDADLSLVRQFGLKICWGAEWYRFPGSYLVPAGIEPLLVESGFDGMLPRPFPPVVSATGDATGSTAPRNGLFGETSRVLGRTTRIIPSGFNDLNRAEKGQAADPARCDYFVHLRLLGDSAKPPAGEWDDVVCFPFLDASRSSTLTRALWVPGAMWQRGNTFGEYCLLRDRKKAIAREAQQWSKVAA